MELNPELLGVPNPAGMLGWPYSDVKGGARGAMFTQSQKQKEVAVNQQQLQKRFRNDKWTFLFVLNQHRLETNVKNVMDTLSSFNQAKLEEISKDIERVTSEQGDISLVWTINGERFTAHIGLETYRIVSVKADTGEEIQTTEHQYTHEDIRVGKVFGNYVIDEYTGEIVHRTKRTRAPIKQFTMGSNPYWAGLVK